MTVNEYAAAARLAAVQFTHRWFENNSGWAEPTRDSLIEWFGDDVCQCPDECWVAPEGICEHGLASWWVVLSAMGEHHDVDVPQRSTILTHSPNFREIGGLPTPDGRTVRSGIVYRSGVMDLLDDADVSQLRGLGIKTIIDVRSTGEVEARPNRLPDGITTHHVPVHDVSAAPRSIIERIAEGDTEGMGAPLLINGNRAFATHHIEVFQRVVPLLADPELWPVVVHCTAGKDRTGFSIAALLWTLGVEPSVVVEDYLRSNEALDERHATILAEVEAKGLDPTVLREMLECTPEYIGAGYDAALQAHGTIDRWVTDALGISAEQRATMQDLMLQ